MMRTLLPLLCTLALAARGDTNPPPVTNAAPPEFLGWFTNRPAVYAVVRDQTVNTTNGVVTAVTNRVFHHYFPDSLSHFVWTNFIAHTNGRSTRLWGMKAHPTGWPTNAPILTWSTNGLLWGIKGLTAWSQCWEGEGSHGHVPITALTRRHGYARGHGMAPEGLRTNWMGQKIWFVDTNNQLVEVKIVHAIVSLNRGDYTILSFDRDLPPGIEPLRVTDVVEMRARYPSRDGAPRPVCEAEQSGQVNTTIPGFSVPAWKGGDSGSPDMLLLGNELILYGGRSTANPSPAMQTDIDTLCKLEGLDPQQYQLRWMDLSRFPAYPP